MSETGQDVVIEIERPSGNPGVGEITVDTPPPDNWPTEDEFLALMLLLA